MTDVLFLLCEIHIKGSGDPLLTVAIPNNKSFIYKQVLIILLSFFLSPKMTFSGWVNTHLRVDGM